MILDKLLEKKDLLIYIEHRIKHLERKREEALYFAPTKIKEKVRQRFHGRILELKYLKKHLDILKSTSKRYWLDCAIKDGRKYEL